MRLRAHTKTHRRAGEVTAAGAAVVVTAVVTITVSWPYSSAVWWIDASLRAWGLLTAVPGLLCWWWESPLRLGQLIVAVAGTYYLQFLRGVDQQMVFAVGFCLAYLWTAVVAHVVLTWPTGRVTRRAQLLLVVTCYAAAVGSQVLRYVVDQPVPPLRFGVADPRTTASDAASALFVVCAVAVTAVMVRHWITATHAQRRPGAPVWAAVLVAAALGMTVSVMRLASPGRPPEVAVLIASMGTGLLLVPVVYAVQLLRSLTARWRLAKVAIGLDRSPGTVDELEDQLARAVGDPGLRLYYRLADGSYIDVAGNRTPAPHPSATRGVTQVQRHGRLFAVISHDPALSDGPGLSDAAGAAAGLAIEHASLYTALQQRIKQLSASRKRLASAAFAERRRIQRDLHDGAQQRLFAVLVLLDMARQQLDEPPDGEPKNSGQARETLIRAHSGLSEAIRTLRELTEGIYPVVLIEHGLGEAVQNLADLSPLPVDVAVASGRWPQHVEITAYFVIAEALANVYKHSQATQATVEVTTTSEDLLVVVTDNGCGPSGTTWRGLTDRVAVVGGFLSIEPRSGSGTRVRATLPLVEH